MNQGEMVEGLRAEIAKLQRVIDLLLEGPGGTAEVRRPGRPKGSGNKTASVKPDEVTPQKRTLSAEGKARIAAAQKKRWAAQRSTAPASRSGAALTKRSGKVKSAKASSKAASAKTKTGAAGKRAGSKRASVAAKSKS